MVFSPARVFGVWYFVEMMMLRRLCLLVLLVFGAFAPVQSLCLGDDNDAARASEEELIRQFQIYRDAIFFGPNESMRVNAATELLMSEDGAARRILLEALRQDDSPVARDAVYRSLIDSRRWRWSGQVQHVEDFIAPLVEGLLKRSREEASLIAEALRVFEYNQIGGDFRAILDDPGANIRSKLNVVEALSIRPEGEAITELIRLLDGSEEAVASAAGQALQEWIPLGPDKEVWRDILDDLQRKSRADIMRERLKVLETQKRELTARVETWQRMYLSSLTRIYGLLSDSSSRESFLAEQLQSEQGSVRLWGVERVRELSLSEAQLPEELTTRVLTLIGDSNADVRMAVARLLSLRSNIDSAEKLLAQLQVETDESVVLELLGALGSACYFAFLPGSQISLAPEIRTETLEIAGDFLEDDNVGRSLKGAEVLGQLLEQNGLEREEVVVYLGMLRERYAAAVAEDRGGQLRADLLKVMARLCEQGVHRSVAGGLFRGVFAAGIGDERSAVREASLAGLAAIDRAEALELVRREKLYDDPSETIRQAALRLAAAAGGEQDMQWSIELFARGNNGDAAWSAIRSILESLEGASQLQWIQVLEERELSAKVGGGEWTGVLTGAEQKAVAAEEAGHVSVLRAKLAEFYRSRGNFERAAEYYRLLHSQATGKEKDEWGGYLVEAYLEMGDEESLKRLEEFIEGRLDRSDIREGELFVGRIEAYLSNNPDNAGGVLGVLGSVSLNGEVPRWHEQYGAWVARFSAAAGEDG